VAGAAAKTISIITSISSTNQAIKNLLSKNQKNNINPGTSSGTPVSTKPSNVQAKGGGVKSLVTSIKGGFKGVKSAIGGIAASLGSVLGPMLLTVVGEMLWDFGSNLIDSVTA
jgi:hypothetical protein